MLRNDFDKFYRKVGAVQWKLLAFLLLQYEDSFHIFESYR